MNRKSTIGMVLLVAMVLAKAYFFDYENGQPFLSTQNETAATDATDFSEFSVNKPIVVSSQTDLLAANFNSPDIADFAIEEKSVEVFEPAIDLNDVATNIETAEDIEETIIPMDYTSNTGYGFWKTPSEGITSKSERSGGKVPLDGGNTITDNISKLFPRVP